jgi:LysR family transcriptional activator of nhaA
MKAMEWLNYNHLFYFWTVVREGGLTQAGRALRLSHPTLSAQVHALEERIGHKLFVRAGRRLQPTEMGRLVYGYAEEIFSLGREMLDAVQGRPAGGALRLQVGVVDAVPKLIVRSLLQPAFRMARPVRLICHEDSYEKLLSELALYNLDIVLADAPVPSGSSIRAFSHPLGDCGVGIFGSPALARKHRVGFPRSLEGAPMLLPLPGSPLRRALDQWFDANHVRPRIVAEFEDRALLNVFGADGAGLFPAPLAVQREVRKQHGVSMVGEIRQVRERFYAVSVQRRLEHPAVVALTEAARAAVFAE